LSSVAPFHMPPPPGGRLRDDPHRGFRATV
jgi:hypothetical protein